MQRKLLAFLLLPLAACQEAPLQPETPYTGPVNVSVAAASTAFVKCGEEIPVTVTVTGSNGRPLSGFHLNFNVLQGGGRMFGGAALTNRSGIARDIWTVGGGAHLSNTLAVRAVDASTGVATTYFTQTVTTLSRIAFASNRHGNDEIYVMNADGSNLMRLTHTNDGAANYQPTWSPDGSRIAFRSGDDNHAEIYVMDADGSHPVRLTNNLAFDGEPAWSPDASRIAFISQRDHNDDIFDNYEIYVMDANGSNVQRLTYTSNEAARLNREPAWSPDGRQIAFASTRDGNYKIYVMNANGSNVQRMTDNPAVDREPAWSPDGSRIAFSSLRPGHANYQIYVMNADGSNVRRLTNNSAFDAQPVWSPDGSQIAFIRVTNSNYEVYVMNADGSNQRNLTNHSAFDEQPAWSGCTP